MTLTGHAHRALTRAAVLAALTLPLVAAPTSSAHTLGSDTARSVAAKQAVKIKRETSATSSLVSGCARQSSHKVLCKVRSRYRVGLRTCVTNVLVYYSNHADRRAGAAIGRTKCS